MRKPAVLFPWSTKKLQFVVIQTATSRNGLSDNAKDRRNRGLPYDAANTNLPHALEIKLKVPAYSAFASDRSLEAHCRR